MSVDSAGEWRNKPEQEVRFPRACGPFAQVLSAWHVDEVVYAVPV